MIYSGEVEGELLLPAAGNHLLQKEGCRITSELELGLLRVRRSVDREGGSKAELCLAQTAGFGEGSSSGFLQVGAGQGGTWVTCGRSWCFFSYLSSSATQAAGHPWWCRPVTRSSPPWRQWQLSVSLLQIPKLLQVMPWTVWHTRPWPEGCCVLSYARRPH